MSTTLTMSAVNAKIKTRNAILRMKKCSPKIKTILRQRCKERIYNERLKILNSIRSEQIRGSFLNAFGNILYEEWKNIEQNDNSDLPYGLHLDSPKEGFRLEDELILEDLLEKELIYEHESWLLQEYEDILNEELSHLDEIVCPVCCLGYLKIKSSDESKMIFCSNCPTNFPFDKSIVDLQSIIYEYLEEHDKQCEYNPSFVNVPKNDTENNLCIVCYHCSYLNIIV